MTIGYPTVLVAVCVSAAIAFFVGGMVTKHRKIVRGQLLALLIGEPIAEALANHYGRLMDGPRDWREGENYTIIIGPLNFAFGNALNALAFQKLCCKVRTFSRSAREFEV